MTQDRLATALILLAVLTPPMLLLASLARPAWRPAIARLIPLAPLPALAAAFAAIGASAILPAPLALSLALDGPGALLLGAAALLWSAAGVAARAWWGKSMETLPYQSWWLATLTGSIAVFMAADVVTFYLAYSLVSLAGYGLVTRDGSDNARASGRVYFAFAVLGEALLLAGLVLMAGGSEELRIATLVARLPASPMGGAALALILAGLGAKMGLAPLHLWMPVSYRAAPFPAAAILSGAAVKAGVIGLVRFLPFAAALPGPGEALAIIGFFSAFFGVAIGLMQRDPKAVLAYSSISQMGLIAAVAGLSLAAGRAGAPSELAFYALHHLFAKGGLFLGLAMLATTGQRQRTRAFWPLAIVALGIAGLPLTGGSLAKLAVKDAFGDGWPKLLASLSATASTLLMLHFLRLARSSGPRDADARAANLLRAAWWTIALAAIAGPWLLEASIGDEAAKALASAALLDLSWPMLLGGAIFLVMRRAPPLPAVPPGDLLVPLLRLRPRITRLLNALATAETWLTGWTTAGAVLLLLAAALAGVMVAVR